LTKAQDKLQDCMLFQHVMDKHLKIYNHPI